MINLLRGIISCLISFFSTTLNANILINPTETELKVHVTPVKHDLNNVKTSPKIRFIDGYILSSDDHNFGGWSGMDIDKKGNIILISDTEGIYLKSDNTEFTNSKIGRAHLKSRWKDFEELEIVQDKIFDGCLVANESTNKILYYNKCDFSKNPKEIKTPNWHSYLFLNQGIEGFTYDNSGKILAIAEKNYDKNGILHKGFYWDPNSNYEISFSYKSESDYRITSITHLKNDDILVVERLFKTPPGYYLRFILTKLTQYFGMQMFGSVKSGINVKYLRKKDIYENAEVKGQTVISIKGGDYDRNYESITTQETNNITKIFMITDDNFLKTQPTMLLEFEIIGKITHDTDDTCFN